MYLRIIFLQLQGYFLTLQIAQQTSMIFCSFLCNLQLYRFFCLLIQCIDTSVVGMYMLESADFSFC